jgi:hypothetical protein
LYLRVFFYIDLSGITFALVWRKMEFWGEDKNGYAVLSQS